MTQAARQDEWEVIAMRREELRRLKPSDELLKWEETEVWDIGKFLDRFWDRPSSKVDQPLAVRLHVALSAYSRELLAAIRKWSANAA